MRAYVNPVAHAHQAYPCTKCKFRKMCIYLNSFAFECLGLWGFDVKNNYKISECSFPDIRALFSMRTSDHLEYKSLLSCTLHCKITQKSIGIF